MRRPFSRRKLFRDASAVLTVPALFHSARARTAAAVPQAVQTGNDIFRSIGVRPVINARGPNTLIGGSLMLPEVRAAMSDAARQHANFDELMAAIGARLAELTKAEWGMVSSGCAGAITLATAACVAGGNPDLHVRIPDLAGFPKDEVIIPTHSRNVYDAGVRAVGARIVQVSTRAELQAALGPRTAMIYLYAAKAADESPLNTRTVIQIASAAGVPVFVDAAAEILTIPNVHLQAGAALVGYSGGKYLRGPQSAGLLIGRKDLVTAAWVHSAPHFGFGRSMKVSKEEAIGMLTAVEMWTKRDHQAEWNQWLSAINTITERVTKIDGVTTSIAGSRDELEDPAPVLTVQWDKKRIGIRGAAVAADLASGEPRILTAGSRDTADVGSISIKVHMMAPGDELAVAARTLSVLSNAPRPEPSPPPAPPEADISGQWDVQITYAASSATHRLAITQRGNRLQGLHHGNFVARDLSGTVSGNAVRISSQGELLDYAFSGTISANEMSGSLSLGGGGYFTAKWTATRHA